MEKKSICTYSLILLAKKQLILLMKEIIRIIKQLYILSYDRLYKLGIEYSGETENAVLLGLELGFPVYEAELSTWGYYYRN